MRIVIIEDEHYTAGYLKEMILQVAPDAEVIKMLSGVTEAKAYFNVSIIPDLIFCDIHLADGSGFDIFSQSKITTPVIFVTAYDQYALQAFKANGIDYILKPFNGQSILEAINKFRVMYASRTKDLHYYGSIIESIKPPVVREPSSLLIKFGEKIKPVKIKDIAFIRTENKWVHLVTFQNEMFVYNKTLEEMEKTCGESFYRVNRQVLLNREAIGEVLQTYSRKLLVQLKVNNTPTLEINKTKMSHFLTWLSA
ncbi:LytR/AlgR family response regulator transcription factor [Niabella sp. 22666]|uniref:LytR/AlgR family response regulator transcription factor n=1 Tax=Niabella sp. 22666 TaxID=3453954 RepID=UPI003F83C5BA